MQKDSWRKPPTLGGKHQLRMARCQNGECFVDVPGTRLRVYVNKNAWEIRVKGTVPLIVLERGTATGEVAAANNAYRALLGLARAVSNL